MSKVQVDTIDTRSGTSTMQIGSTNTSTINIGVSGDTVNIPSGVTIANAGTATGFGEANTPAFAVQGTDEQSSVSNNTYTKVTFNSELKDTDSTFDLSTERFTVPSGKAGLYTFKYSCQNSQKASANNVYQIVLYKNGSLAEGTLVRQNPTTTGNYDVFLNGSASLVLAASDYIEVFYYQNTSGSVNLEANKRLFSGFRVTS